MPEPRLTVTQRHLPHWTLSGSVYYVTFHLASGELTETERQLVSDHVKSGHGRFYDLAAATVMPDHVHLILKPRDGFTLSRILKGIKGASARLLNQRRNATGRVWQEESWDRILRDPAEFDEKLQYMYNNPVKAGLVVAPDTYDGWFYNPSFA
ncbi:MAG TPA: transposase [Thermoguttaceae bacterium]|nr:transposase [Thermoguttaceae bacterium]